MEVVKREGLLIFDMSDELRKDKEIITIAIKSIERDIRNALIEEDRSLYWTLRFVSYAERYQE